MQKDGLLDTLCGSFTILAQAENFRKRILEDRSADDKIKAKVDSWLVKTLDGYAEQMGFSQMKRRAVK